MKSTSFLLLILSLIIAAILSYAIYNSLDSNGKVVEEKKIMIVASQDIEINQKITEEMIKEEEINSEIDLSNYYLNKSDIIGQFVYDDIYEGEGFHKSKLSGGIEDILIRKIDKNHRGITLAVNKYSGVSDLIKPGNFVDIYVFLPEKTRKEKLIYPNTSKLFLQNVKVLSINQESSRSYESPEEIAKTYPITLSIEKEKIESLVLAENIGILKLALRPIGDTDIEQSYGKVWQELIIDNQLEIRNLLPKYEINNDLLKINNRINQIKNESVSNNENNNEKDYYKVKYGDTLYGISLKFYNDGSKYNLIKKANGIGNNNLIITGEILKIPKDE